MDSDGSTVAEPRTTPSRPAHIARLVALYLPQYYPTPENSEWWGQGYTEWTAVTKARPLFLGHQQPNLPSELGFYDLRLPETRAAQAELASTHGIEAFCYWHYWFAGRRLLDRPFREVLSTHEPRFPFCLAWANQSWTGVWHGLPDKILVQQTYPGARDHEAHFLSLVEAFSDDRYLLVDGKPLFVVFRPFELPDAKRTLDSWRSLAHTVGLKGLFLVGQSSAGRDLRNLGFDGSFGADVAVLRRWARRRQPFARLRWLRQSRVGRPAVCSYTSCQSLIATEFLDNAYTYPCVLPNWDNTPRVGTEGLVLQNPDPSLFQDQVRRAAKRVSAYPPSERLVFVKSWNEWAEGNHLEPSMRYGRSYLEATRDEILTPRDQSS